MITINVSWYTCEDNVFPVTFKISKEEIERYHDRDQNMTKIMTLLESLYKIIMGDGAQVVNVMGSGVQIHKI